jgi:hypothetical protein
MRALGAAELLEVWERGLHQTLPECMLALLARACPEIDVGDLAALPIGRRDTYLLELREQLFGPELTLVAPCPRCGGQLESRMRVAELRVEADDAAPSPHQAEYNIECDSYRIGFRLPASEDFFVLSPAMERKRARQILLTRCLVRVNAADGVPTDPGALPERVVADVCAAMAAADPQADLELNMACPSCGNAWLAMFDIASFLWKEIQAWAKHTLRAVHALARAYGWREIDILAMSPTRRQIYLELARP